MKQSRESLTSKVGKKSFFSDDFILAGVLVYETGIEYFDAQLQGRSLEDINSVIHLVKYPKGIVVKIAKNFSSVPHGIAYSEIERILIIERKKESSFIIKRVDDTKISFNFKTSNIDAVKKFLQNVSITFDLVQEIEVVKPKALDLSDSNTRNHGIPAIISFFVPGLGQLLKKQFLKAIGIWLSCALIWFALVNGFGIFTYFILFCLWAWNVYDAYNTD